MKRQFYILLIGLGILFPAAGIIASPTAGAIDIFKGVCTGANDTGTNASSTDVCKDKAGAGSGNPITKAIGDVIGILAFIIGVASTIVIVISGFQMITSQGDPQKMATARTAIIYALVGLAIGVLAGTIVALVLSNL